MHTLSLLPLATHAGTFAFIRSRIDEAWQRWRAREQARETARTLAQLDDRTLRDLGLHRSELGALGAELHGLHAPTLRRAIQVI